MAGADNFDNTIDGTLFQAEEERDEARELSNDVAPEIPGVSLEQVVGSGTFGDVWLGYHQRTGQKVAVKIFTRRFGLDWDYFQKEIGQLREVAEHPNVVTLLDADLAHVPPYLVMPMLSGGSLAGYSLKEDSQLDSRVLVWFTQITEALSYIHRKGILHCDLKPANVLLDEEGRAKLVDFGQARESGAGESSLGTLGYMPPEQAYLALGESQMMPSPGWDIYSLGATMYNLLTGQLPRIPLSSRSQLSHLTDAGERLNLYVETLQKAPLLNLCELNPGVDRDLAAIIEACLKLDPDQRTASASEVLEDLERRRDGLPLLARRPWTRSYRASKFLRKNRANVALSCVIGAMMIVLGSGPQKGEVAKVASDPLAETGIASPSEEPIELKESESPVTQTSPYVDYLKTAEESSPQTLSPPPLPVRWIFPTDQPITWVKTSPEGFWLALGTADGRAHLLDTETGLAEPLPGLSSVAFAAKEVALGYQGGQVERRTRRLQLLSRSTPHSALVSSLHYQGKKLVSSSLDGSVRGWSGPPGFASPVLAAASDSSGRWAVALADGTLRSNGKLQQPDTGGLVSEIRFQDKLEIVLSLEDQLLRLVFDSNSSSFQESAFSLPKSTEVKDDWLIFEPNSEREARFPLSKNHQMLCQDDQCIYLLDSFNVTARERRPSPSLDPLPQELRKQRAELLTGMQREGEFGLRLFQGREWLIRREVYERLLQLQLKGQLQADRS